MLEKELSKLGFSPSEAKIYMHLLKAGRSYANRISSQTKINRSNVYEALDRLIAKGVVSFIVRNNIRWFEAKDPDSIISLVDSKEEELQKTKAGLLKDIEDIKKTIPLDRESLEANVFVGKKGLRVLFEEMLEAKRPISIIAAEWQFKDFFGPYFELWHRERIEKKIPQRSIFPKKLNKKVKKRELLELHFVDDRFTNPTTTIIYGDNCILIQWSKEPIAIKIQNRQITKSHRNYFNILWSS